MSTAEMKKGATKLVLGDFANQIHVIPESMPIGTHFIRFAKVGKIKDGMTEWEKNKQNEFTEKAKKWVHACGRKGFTIDKLLKIHIFVDGILLVEMVQLKKILTESMPHC